MKYILAVVSMFTLILVEAGEVDERQKCMERIIQSGKPLLYALHACHPTKEQK